MGETRKELENGCYVIIYFNPTDDIATKTYYDRQGALHRDNNLPAYVEFEHKIGAVRIADYYIHGILKRTDGDPSIINYYADGSLWGYMFTDENGEPHSPFPNEPCSVSLDLDGYIDEVSYSIHGKDEREDGDAPFIEYHYGEVYAVSYDGTREGEIDSSRLNDKELRKYDVTNIKIYKIKNNYFKDSL